MDELQNTIQRYRHEYSTFQLASELMKVELKDIAKRAGVLAEFSVRAKDISSFVKKAMTKEGYREDAWNKTTDKVGARIVVETRTQKIRVLESLVASELTILDVTHQDAGKKPSELFYPGIHIQCVIPNVKLSTGEDIECEIQLRTKAEDLWAVPSHQLIYKAIVTPSRKTERRIWRLSAMTEIFDEEVERAISEVRESPDYHQANLLSVAEDFYYTFVPIAGDRDLSFEVLLEVAEALPSGSQVGLYRQAVSTFVEANRARIESIYKDFGDSSPFADEAKYWLFTQPESLLLFHSIATEPMKLRAVAQASDFDYAFEELFEAWGVPFNTPASA